MPDGDETEHNAQVWLDHARWYYDSVNADFDAVNRQCVAALSLAGVILVLTAGTLSQQDGNVRWFVALALCLDAFAALIVLCNLRPRKIDRINIGELRDEWDKTAKDLALESNNRSAAAYLTEQLLHGTEASREKGAGPLSALNDLSQHRSKRLVTVYGLITASLICVAVSTCIVIA